MVKKKWIIHRAKARRYKKRVWRQRHKSGMLPRRNKIFGQMRQLPIVKIGNKKYFVDARLNELRNVNNPHDKEKMEGSEDFYVKNFGSFKNFGSNGKEKRLWNVSIASPYYKPELAWTASTDFDILSADTLATLGGKNVPIEKIEASTQKEAIREYKKRHPEFKKHFRQMDKEDVELSI